MGQIRSPQPVLLFAAVFSAEESAFVWTRQQAESLWGKIVRESGPFPVEQFTGYYAPSMGHSLPKFLWAFENLIDPADLPDIKRLSNEWEEQFKRQTCAVQERPLNIDPGYVDLGKLILASTKDHAHRIYLSGGIFAETTLIYTQKEWKPLPWTYPDYQSPGYQTFFTQCREYLKTKRSVIPPTCGKPPCIRQR
ncbi:MAG: DUF4416 family protein [Planctomycetaceae bacterium]|jgi:hypothetical protein|nr:DUF4416 family protein [Planctomycetaceae bacterium]